MLLVLALTIGAVSATSRILIARSEAARWLQGVVLIEGGRPSEIKKRLQRWLRAIDPTADCRQSGWNVDCRLANDRVVISRQEQPGRQAIQVRVRAWPQYWVQMEGARYDMLPGGFL